MSDSDDTDYLLLIPPNFFWVPSDQEDDRVPQASTVVDREIVDGLLSHVNRLENRVAAIESVENSLAAGVENATARSSLDVRLKTLYGKGSNYQQVLNWVRSNDFLLNRDVSNEIGFSDNLENSLFSIRTSDLDLYAASINIKDKLTMSSPFKDSRGDEVLKVSPKKSELTEVDRLLKEMEVTQRDIENKLRSREQESVMLGAGDVGQNSEKARSVPLLGDNIGSVPDLGFGARSILYDSLKGNSGRFPTKPEPKPVIEEPFTRRSISLVGGSKEENVDKWKTYNSHDYNAIPSRSSDPLCKSPEKSYFTPSVRRKLPLSSPDARVDTPSHSDKLASPLKSVAGSPLKFESRFSERNNPSGKSAVSESSHSTRRVIPVADKAVKSNSSEHLFDHKRNEQFPPDPSFGTEKLLSLNELWKGDDDTMASNPGKLMQKLEEEKYRRSHLENTVQALQKKVLEEQEKLAVAIRVDEKKDLVIEKVTDAWKKMVDHWKQIEEQRHAASQALITERAVTKRSQEEINKRVVRWEKEVSQALDLAAGFKAKAESLEQQLSSTKEELTDKLMEVDGRLVDAELLVKQKDKEMAHLQERLEGMMHDLHEERKTTEDVKVEAARLEGSLGQLEAELAVVKEQRDLLAQRIKEETSRVKLLEQQKHSLEMALTDSSSKQKEAEDNYKVAKKHLESVKMELKSLYQSQLESVVREKLAEFQSQLETARDDMRHQLDAELAASRESARRQQQSLVNSHVAEMRRLESIHKEEMSSLERRLGEAESRCAKLELAKRDVAHKLHKVMENQWQQALGIITGELSLRQVDSDFDRGVQRGVRNEDLSHSLDQESPCKEIPIQPNKSQFTDQNQLFKYIEMMLDKQPGRVVDTLDSSVLQDSCDLLDDPTIQPLNWNSRLRPGMPGNDGDKDSKKPPWK